MHVSSVHVWSWQSYSKFSDYGLFPSFPCQNSSFCVTVGPYWGAGRGAGGWEICQIKSRETEEWASAWARGSQWQTRWGWWCHRCSGNTSYYWIIVQWHSITNHILVNYYHKDFAVALTGNVLPHLYRLHCHDCSLMIHVIDSMIAYISSAIWLYHLFICSPGWG